MIVGTKEDAAFRKMAPDLNHTQSQLVYEGL